MDESNFDRELAKVVTSSLHLGSEFAEFARLNQAAGIPPNRQKAQQLGTDIGQMADRHKVLLDGLQCSKDFQALESYYVMEALAHRANAPSLRAVQLWMRWQADGLLAVAESRPLPPMPPGIDPQAISAPHSMPPSMGMSVDRVLPFQEQSFDAVTGGESQILKSSFLRLAKEHRDLVGLGETYADFDPTGKEFYLGQISQMSFRWEDLMERALEAGVAVTPAFKTMSETYLGRANLSPDEFRTTVDNTHSLLRGLINKEKGIGL